MKLVFAAALTLAAFTPSTTQAQSTSCSWVGQIWTCNQTQPQARVNTDIYRQAMENSNRQTEEANRNFWLRQQAQRQARQQAQAYSEAEQAQRLRQYVGSRLAAGDCQGAQASALQAGDIALAKQVQGFCAAKPSQ